ncbi:MAG: glutamine synthetase family protein, partial [Pseudomonadota bacterium]
MQPITLYLQADGITGRVTIGKTTSSTHMTARPDWLTEQDYAFVECVVPDFNGIGKGKVVPLNELESGEIRIAEAILGQDVVGAWCEDHELVDVADVDMVLTPDLVTVRKQPWNNGIAQCVCDCETLDGEPLNIAPRAILKSMIDKFSALGLQPVVAQEAEFYVVDKNPDSNTPLRAATGLSGRAPLSPRSFQVEAMAEYAPFLEKLYAFAADQNIALKGTVQEMGPGQLEVNFQHGDALAKADEMFLFKRLVRQAALAAGYQATFMAKPMSAAAGSAMHLHQSLVHEATAHNAFAGAQAGGFSEMFYHYLGGLQKYTPMAMALLAPNTNSYRRFESAESCPTNVEWGIDNRTTGFRVPRASGAGTRIENRIPGSDNNPYLAIAISLACGYLGIQEGLQPTEP